ncbi:RNA polymerase sigma factor [Microbulbifer yueqingensis]|uniref:RNA polymerase sigma-70 factor, ECF subfamily n=1 Tax=Microbulbifer yueqingensis TaxID=658219 RepID=A0A1G9CSI2_9GAMM|nr:sigma-70 family RNA polymerase sigma factor [Microbulbifer yueqingensis]SDK54587.1 RNA polymerase sigma-70 factor, ECF subfamily [Microbulbifer yueqingensis]
MKARSEQFQQLISDYGGGIARVAGTYTRTPEERDDLLQDIWLAIWRALPGFRGEASVKTFIFRIAHNRSVTELARRRPEADDVLLEGVADSAPGPAERLAGQRKSERLQAAVQALPLGLRQVISLRLEGLGYSEIAEVLGISESNVAVRLNRARQRLSNRLGKHSER